MEKLIHVNPHHIQILMQQVNKKQKEKEKIRMREP